MIGRAIAVTMIFAVAACDQPTAPAPPTRFAANGPSFDNTAVRDNESIDLSGTAVSPCTGEPIVFQGSAHIVATFQPTTDGFTVSTHLNTQGVTGVGLTTGTKYQFVEVSNETLTAASDQSGTASVSTQFRVISDGSADNFLLDAQYTFTFPPPTASYRILDARCQG
jgi:hypothetical protein